MRFRQVHLDFHTSEQIPGVGSRFDATAFAEGFRAAHVESVTLFSKCHHGLSYHPTKIGRMHPGLDFDLLRAQVDALHDVGIRTPIYLSASWDEYAAATHPEWQAVLPDGRLARYRDRDTGWAFLDFSSGYLDYLAAQVAEVMELFPDGDGIFMDISFQVPSISMAARVAMRAAGLDWTLEADRARHMAAMEQAYYARIRDVVQSYRADCPLFFNSGHIRRGDRASIAAYYTHLELESLPTAGWGYDHFPLSARYVDPLGIPFLGMTGKFHFSWGEMGGYKRPEALVYECGAMLAHGAGCSVGDHLHPTGAVDGSTLALIAPAFAHVEAREPWCVGTENRAEIGLLSVEAANGGGEGAEPDHRGGPDEGASRVLLEARFAFDVLDRDSDFSRYRLVILPDAVRVDAALKARIETYVAGGGRVLLTGQSGIDPEAGFLFDLGARWEGTSPMAGGDYLLPREGLRAEGLASPLFMYLPSERIALTDGASLGEVYEPYFERSAKHFSGHLNAPARPDPSGYAAGVEKGGFTYLAHPIFSAYLRSGAVRILEIAEAVIGHALGAPRLVEVALPRAGRVTLRAQAGEGRDVLHLLYATPALRGAINGNPVQPIQDLVPLADVAVSLIPRAPVAAVRMVPGGEAIGFAMEAGRLTFTVPGFTGHGMVEIAYQRA